MYCNLLGLGFCLKVLRSSVVWSFLGQFLKQASSPAGSLRFKSQISVQSVYFMRKERYLSSTSTFILVSTNTQCHLQKTAGLLLKITPISKATTMQIMMIF